MMWWQELINHPKVKLGLVGLCCVTIFIGILLYQRQTNEPKEDELLSINSETLVSETASLQPESELKMFVDLKGAIKQPGVYPIVPNMRLADLIKVAGGLTKEADQKVINQAIILQDQSAIYLPKKGEVDAQTDTSVGLVDQQAENNTGKININQADANELEKLSGIGQSKAQAIIQYREEHGLFKEVDDLKEVSGIGEKTVERLKEDITI